MGLSWAWTERTRPFLDPDCGEPARFVFEQVGDDAFVVQKGFLYAPDGTEDPARVIEVTSDSLVRTDLASIPPFMAWFVPVNGRHTPAALVHDQLVQQSKATGATPGARAGADDTFLQAMAASDVPVLRRHLMHAAVTAATRWTSGGLARVGIGVWVVAALTGTAALLWALVTRNVVVGVVAAVAPIVGAALWGLRRWRAGLLAGYALWFIGAPALACIAGYSVYWVAEQGARSLVARRRDTSRADVPPPAPYR